MNLADKRVIIMATDGFEDSEFNEPYERLQTEQASVTIVSTNESVITGKNGTTYDVDLHVSEVYAEDYDALVLPGGVVNPDKLRMDTDAVRIVREFFEQHKPVSAICHAPWMLVEADVLDGRTITSWPSLRTDVENSGAIWVDKEVVVDEGLTTSRNPDDLPAFCDKMVEEILEGKHAEQTA